MNAKYSLLYDCYGFNIRSLTRITSIAAVFMLTNRQFTLMGTATNHLRCQGEKAFLDFVENNMARINDRFQIHLANRTTYALANKENRKKVLFEYAIGEVYFDLIAPDVREGMRNTATMMHRKMREWFRGGFLAGTVVGGISIFIALSLFMKTKC